MKALHRTLSRLGTCVLSLLVISVAGCRAITVEQVEKWRTESTESGVPVRPTESGRKGEHAGPGSATGYDPGWLSTPDTDRAALQAVVVATGLRQIYRTYMTLEGREPQTHADVLAADLWYLAPANGVGHPLSLTAQSPDVDQGVALHWTGADLSFQIIGGRLSGAGTPSATAIDVPTIRAQRLAATEFAQTTSAQGKSEHRLRQEVLVGQQVELLLFFVTDQQRLPLSLSELYAPLDLVPAGVGIPLPDAVLPGPGGLLFEANDDEQRLRWRSIEPDGSLRWIAGQRFTADYQPVVPHPGQQPQRLDPAEHLTSAGWRTIANFQL